MIEMTNAGKCLKILQARFGISSVELAKNMECHPQQILRWRSQENMKLHTLQRICVMTGITLDEFCEMER
jgi:hypothetical protein